MTRKVLVVEDNQTQQRLMQVLAARFALEVHLVSTGFEAVEAVQNQNYDLVLMDWHLPKMDGLETTRQIRQLESSKGRHTVIVAVTAQESDGNRKSCMEAGMNDFLSKPFSLDEFESVLTRWLPEDETKGNEGPKPPVMDD